MRYKIDKKDRPVYLQLYRLIRDDIISGIYPNGTKLPSKRLLAEELGVSTITVEHTYALLLDEGYIDSHQRSGYFVIFRRDDGFSAVSAHAPVAPSVSSTSSHDLPDFPFTTISRTMRRILCDYGDSVLSRSPGRGCDRLRDAIARYLMRNRGIDVPPSRIVIGSGAEHLYSLIIEMLGINAIYGIEQPSYKKIQQVYTAARAPFRLLPLCSDGIDSASLFATDANVLHTTPYRSYPTGITASASKRHEYIRWGGLMPGRFIIEDDYESEFSVNSKPEDTLFSLSKNDNVIYLNTFSKTISPSLRVGYMVLPECLTALFDSKLGFYSCTVPTFIQIVLAELIDSGDFERHINRVRRAKRRAMQ